MEATENAAVANEVQPPLVEERRRHLGNPFPVLPGDVRLADVFLAAGADAEQRVRERRLRGRLVFLAVDEAVAVGIEDEADVAEPQIADAFLAAAAEDEQI